MFGWKHKGGSVAKPIANRGFDADDDRFKDMKEVKDMPGTEETIDVD